MTKTQERHEFLQKCLKDGMSRPEAAHALMKSKLGKKKNGAQISVGTAHTMVYQGFSGAQFAIKPATPKKKAPAKKATRGKQATIIVVKNKKAARKLIDEKIDPVSKASPSKKKATKPAAKSTKRAATKATVKSEGPARKKTDKVAAAVKPKVSRKMAVREVEKPPMAKKESLKEKGTAKAAPKVRKKRVEEGAELVF